jgi:DNA-binding SARP family transcriptional activator
MVEPALAAPPAAAAARRSVARVVLLRGFSVTGPRGPIRLPCQARKLVAFLALRAAPCDRGYVHGMLWPDASEEQASACLRSALWRLGRQAPGLVRADGGQLVLGCAEIDLRKMAEVARAVLAGVLPPRAERDELIRVGDVLPDWYDDWVALERERFRQLRLHALDRLCERLAAVGEYGEAAEVGLAAITSEPLRESAHRALIRVHIAEGNAAEAVRQLEFFTALLDRALGLRPSPQLAELVARSTVARRVA